MVTAQLFAYLRALQPARVKEAANRLFLFKSIEYLDLEKAVLEGVIGVSMFDMARVTLLVAELDPVEGGEAPRLIAAAGSQFKWVDHNHILVIIRASGGAAVRKAADLAAQVHGVISWKGFDDWRDAQVTASREGRSLPSSARRYIRALEDDEAEEEDDDDDDASGLLANGHAHEAGPRGISRLEWLRWRMDRLKLTPSMLLAASMGIVLVIQRLRRR